MVSLTGELLFLINFILIIFSASHYMNGLIKFHGDSEFGALLDGRGNFNNAEQFSSIIVHNEFDKKISEDGKVSKRKKSKYKISNLYMIPKPSKENENKEAESSSSKKKQRNS